MAYRAIRRGSRALFSHQAMTSARHSGRRCGPGCGGPPAGADAPDKPAQMAAYLLARLGLAKMQDHGSRTFGRGVMDVDRRKQRSS